jgi:hypothetical protein
MKRHELTPFDIESPLFGSRLNVINACSHFATLKRRQGVAILELMQEILSMNELSHRSSQTGIQLNAKTDRSWTKNAS